MGATKGSYNICIVCKRLDNVEYLSLYRFPNEDVHLKRIKCSFDTLCMANALIRLRLILKFNYYY